MTEPIVLVEWFNDHWYKITEDEKTRYIPSVTTKLQVKDKPGLTKWRGDVGTREADLRLHEAGQRGTRLHWARAVLLKGGAVIYDPWQLPVYTDEGIAALKEKYAGNVVILRTQDEMLQITKLKRQLDILKPEIVGVEVKVYDLKNNDAGTVDGIYRIKKGTYAINGAKPVTLEAGIYVEDFKSGNFLDNNVWLQLAPYGKMVQDMLGEQIMGALVTHTGATTKTGIVGLSTKVCLWEELLGSSKSYYDTYRHISAVWEADHEGDQPETFQFPSLITLGGIE